MDRVVPPRRVRETADAVRDALGLSDEAEPRAGVVLGSGLGPFADALDDARAVPTDALPHVPVSTVAGHAGRVVAGRVEGVPVVVLQGRVHRYEGYDAGAVTHMVRVMAALGVRGVVLTNAAGAMRSDLTPGSLMLVADHISLGLTPTIAGGDVASLVPAGRGGARGDALGGDWLYSPRLRAAAHEAAAATGIALREGCLVFGRGPSYETPAEVRLYRWLGGDAACMSTVPEAIAARLSGPEVLAISCISNLGTGLSPHKLTHDEVTEIAGKVSASFRRLLTETVRRAYG